MCTVSWVQQTGGYHLLANRDEKRTRGRAFAPAIRECGGVRYVAPIDSDFGMAPSTLRYLASKTAEAA